jgi:NO-binding membrane sensor protein with MHYT domain
MGFKTQRGKLFVGLFLGSLTGVALTASFNVEVQGSIWLAVCAMFWTGMIAPIFIVSSSIALRRLYIRESSIISFVVQYVLLVLLATETYFRIAIPYLYS